MDSLPAFIIQKIEEIAFSKVSENDSLIKSGVLDSINVVELAVEIERKLGVRIPLEDINAQNFETVVTLTEYLERLPK